MNIAAYVHLNRLRTPTGVGKHILRMVEGIRSSHGRNLRLLVSRKHAQHFPPEEFWPNVPYDTFPGSFKVMQRIWLTVNRPFAEQWCGNIDWVYCPAESYVPVRRARLVVTIHDVHAFETNLPWSNSPEHLRLRLKWSVLFGRIKRHADLVVTVSEFTKKRLVELFQFDEQRIKVVGNGVDDLFFSRALVRQASRLVPSSYIIVVGGLTQRKGGDLVLKAARELRLKTSELRIIVVGNGEARLEAEAAGIGNVSCLGYVDDVTLHSLLAESLCLLFLSRYEGFGIPIAEGMAAGAPVVALQTTAVPEVLGDAGFLVSSVEEAIEWILRLRTNSQLADHKRMQGRLRAEDFRWSPCSKRLLSAISSVTEL